MDDKLKTEIEKYFAPLFYAIILFTTILLLVLNGKIDRKDKEIQSQLDSLESRIEKQDSLVNEFRYDLQILQEDMEELK